MKVLYSFLREMDIEDLPLGKLPGIQKLEDLVSNYYESRLLNRVKRRGKLPNHVGVILDGNRRFAAKKGLTVRKGHMMGAEKLEDVLDWVQELGIRYMTVYAFSKENFDRSVKEVQNLMGLFKTKFEEIVNDERVHKNQVRVNAVGDLDSLPPNVRESIEKAEEVTEDYDNYFLNIAIGYGGRAELADAVQKICKKVKEGEVDPTEVNEKLIEDNLYTADLPDPDLIIRTSGEERLSGFLLWQSAYSELYFCEAYWPEFDKVNFLQAIYNYQGRERRYGE